MSYSSFNNVSSSFFNNSCNLDDFAREKSLRKTTMSILIKKKTVNNIEVSIAGLSYELRIHFYRFLLRDYKMIKIH